jgi:hypothetical protein
MNVASLELCKELYELSGWDDTYFSWNFNSSVPEQGWYVDDDNLAYPKSDTYPAYDLGYLLQKLPKNISRNGNLYWLTLDCNLREEWMVWYNGRSSDDLMPDVDYSLVCADTPEDAAAKLAIELFKQGILKPLVEPLEPSI